MCAPAAHACCGVLLARVLGPSCKAAGPTRWQQSEMEQHEKRSHHLGRLVIKYQLLAHTYLNAASLPALMPASPRPNPPPHDADQWKRPCQVLLVATVLKRYYKPHLPKQIQIRGTPL